jgi:hypothetical protein
MSSYFEDEFEENWLSNEEIYSQPDVAKKTFLIDGKLYFVTYVEGEMGSFGRLSSFLKRNYHYVEKSFIVTEEPVVKMPDNKVLIMSYLMEGN